MCTKTNFLHRQAFLCLTPRKPFNTPILYPLFIHACCRFSYLLLHVQLSPLSGSDRDGHPVIVISACRLPPSDAIDHNVLLRYTSLLHVYTTLYAVL